METIPKIDEDYVYLRLKWVNCITDSSPYKIYSPLLMPMEVCIEISLPKKYLISSDQNQIVITPRGMAEALKQIKRQIDIIYQSEE